MAQVLVSHEELLSLCAGKLEKAGIHSEHAATVADVLVYANLRGIDSHGVMRLEHYLKRIASGGINTDPRIKIRDTATVCAVVDGDDGLGHVVAKKAMDYAVELAAKSGVGMVGVINSSHCGALSYYVKQTIDRKMIGIAMSHTDKAVVPFGGAQPFFGTNPIAFGFPTGDGQGIILDMATSSVAYGKIIQAKEKGESIPAGWAVDEAGKVTTDPNRYAALTHFGGPKGFGLAMVVDIFCGILTGSAFGPHVALMYGDYERKRKLGHFVIAVNINMFIGVDRFLANIDRMTEEIHAVPPAEGFEKVMVPGEPENSVERERRKKGIPLDETLYCYLAGKL